MEDEFDSAIEDSPLEEARNMFEESKEEDEREIRARQVLEMAARWKPSQYPDDHKCENASYYGGFQLLDQELTARLRSAAKELIVMAGKKILNG